MVKIVKWNFLWTAQEYESVALQLTGYISPDNVLFFKPEIVDIFLVSPQKNMLWYSFEVPRRGASNEYNNICFHGKIRKIFSQYPFLSGAMHSLSKIKQ